MADALPRMPEPELMDSAEQVEAYSAADFSETNQHFADRLVAALSAAGERGRLVDLGCGPGDICIRSARALPDGWRFVALDAGKNMLDQAERAVRRCGLSERIELHLARLPEHGLEESAFDAVISNSLLHHLPEPESLWSSVRRLAAPSAWIQVMDLARPDSVDEAEALVQTYAGDEPEVLRNDFRNSLHAAWRIDEVRSQLAAAGLPLACDRVSDRHWLVSGRLP
jgi:ubiquinone/menaquinone biosynthesis C-methylase UbiE